MKKNNYIIKIITIVICLLPILVGMMMYDKLPNEIPIHFNMNNEADNYAHKNIALFIIPVVMTVIQIIILVFMQLATRKEEEKPKLESIMYWFVPILTILIYTIMIVYSLGYEINVGKYICFAIGLIFCIIGNYMPKMNYESATRMMHPKPKDEKTYRKVIKIYGYSFVGIGIILFVMALFV